MMKATPLTSNSSADEIANMNFVYDVIAHVEYSIFNKAPPESERGPYS